MGAVCLAALDKPPKPPPKPRKSQLFQNSGTGGIEVYKPSGSVPKPANSFQPEKVTTQRSKDADGLVTIKAFAGPAEGLKTCISVPHAKEEVSKDGSEKFFNYTITVRLAGNQTHTVKHRFSQFATFHSEWRAEYPGVDIALPSKVIGKSDDDIAKRCYDLQQYLRRMVAVNALIWVTSKFLKLDETDLKQALRGTGSKSVTIVEEPSLAMRSASRKSMGKSAKPLPKVSLNQVEQQRESASDGGRAKVKFEDTREARVEKETKPEETTPANPNKVEHSPQVPPSQPAPVESTPKDAEPSSAPPRNFAIPARSGNDDSGRPQSIRSSKNLAPPPKVIDTGGISLKDRMAAFQKG